METALKTRQHFGRKLFLAALALVSGSLTATAQATYPDRPITFVSAFAPGATNDFLTRFVAQGGAQALDATQIGGKRPGANGTVGTAFVAAANPDGSPLLMGTAASHGINPTLYPKAQNDASKDFQGV